MRQPLEVLRGRLEVIAPHIVSRALWCEVGGREEEARRLVGALLRWLALPAEGVEGVEGAEGAEGAEGVEGAEEEVALCEVWRAALSLKSLRSAGGEGGAREGAPLSAEEGVRLMCQVEAHALALAGEGGVSSVEWRRGWSQRLERLMRFVGEEGLWLNGARASREGEGARRAVALLGRARPRDTEGARALAREVIDHAARSGGIAASFARLYQAAMDLNALTGLVGALREGGLSVVTVSAGPGGVRAGLWAALVGATTDAQGRAGGARGALRAWEAHAPSASARWWEERLLSHALAERARGGRLTLCVLNAQALTDEEVGLCERLLLPTRTPPLLSAPLLSAAATTGRAGAEPAPLEAPHIMMILHTPRGASLPERLTRRDDLTPLTLPHLRPQARASALLKGAAALEGVSGEGVSEALLTSSDERLSDDELWWSLACLAEAGQLRWEGGWTLAPLPLPSRPRLTSGARLRARLWALSLVADIPEPEPAPAPAPAPARIAPSPPPHPLEAPPTGPWGEPLSEEGLTRLAGTPRGGAGWAAARAGFMALSWARGDHALADQFAEEALSAEGGLRGEHIAGLWAARAHMAAARGDEGALSAFLRAAWEVSEGVGDLAGQARALALAGRLAAQRGGAARAVALLEGAKERWGLIEERGEEARCALERAQLLHQLGVLSAVRATADELRARAPEARVTDGGLRRDQAGALLHALVCADLGLHEEVIATLAALNAPLSALLDAPGHSLCVALALDALTANALSLARLCGALAPESGAPGGGEAPGGALLNLMSAARESARRARLHPSAAPRHVLGARLTDTLITLITQRVEVREERLSLSGALSDLERAWGERAGRGELDLSATLRYALCLAEEGAARRDGFAVAEATSIARGAMSALTRLLDTTPWRSAATPPSEWQRLLELTRP